MILALQLKHTTFLFEAGCDEAGRGCLAGPVVAAAVILPDDFKSDQLDDSKKLSEKKRMSLRDEIVEGARCFGIGVVHPGEIDEINILNASFLAMHRAIEKLTTTPEFLLIDGNRFNPFPGIPHACMVKGDGRFLNIAAASVLAKTHRDKLMENLDAEFPEYGWKRNKGYPTAEHREAIRDYGPTLHHRKSFQLLPSQLSLEI